MMKKQQAAWVYLLLCSIALGSEDAERAADRILASSPRADGLCVIVNASDPELAVALTRGSKCVVHAIHDGAVTVDAMRTAMDRCGIYGRASAQHSEMDSESPR